MEADFGFEGALLVEGVERPPRSDSLQDFYDMLKEEYGEDDENFVEDSASGCAADYCSNVDGPIGRLADRKVETRADMKRGRDRDRSVSGQNENAIDAKKPKKRRKGAPLSVDSVAEFYGELLSWGLAELYNQSLTLPLSETRVQFNVAAQFYYYCRELVMEETAANASAGLQQIGRANSVTLRYVGDAFKRVGDLLMLITEVVYGSSDLTRPGSCFVIYPQHFKHQKFNFNASLGIGTDSTAKLSGIFGAVAPNREAAVSKKVPMYVHESYYSSMVENGMLQRGSIWVAHEVCNVITAHRMAAVCGEQPKPHFLSKILGGKIASHIIFDDAESRQTSVVVPGTSLPASRTNGVVCTSGIVPGHSLSGRASPTIIREGFAKHLNGSQLIALDDVVRNTCGDENIRPASGVAFKKKGSLCLVQGPPGCGKSTFLTALLEVLVLKKGKRVLACAPSNKAVCVLLEKFLAMKEFDPSHRDALTRIVLIGVEDKLDLDFTCSATADVNNKSSASPWALSAPTAAALRVFTNPQRASDMFAYRLGDRVSVVMQGLSTDLNHFLRRIEAMTNSEIKLQIRNINFFLDGCRSEIEATVERLKSICPRITKRELSPYFSVLFCIFDEISESDASIDSFITDFRNFIVSITAKLLEISAYVSCSDVGVLIAGEAVANADVVFCTLACSGQSIMRRVQQIEVMVVDEAAQALEPELCIAFSLYPDNLVLVGDPCQLSATLLSPRAQQQGRGNSTMKRLMNFCDRPFHLLSVQYRMHPQLSLLPNKLFYMGRISDSEHVINRKSLFGSQQGLSPWLENFAFFDVQGKEHTRDGLHRFSMSNIMEAQFIAKLLRYLAVSQLHVDISSQICVITFYSGQVAAINGSIKSEAEKLNDRTLADKMRAIKVLTVDSFQGSETDIVVLSFVRSNPKNSVGFLSDFSRINVAITRAKHNLFCVGNAQTLENCKLDYLRTLVRNSKERSKFFSAVEVSAMCFST